MKAAKYTGAPAEQRRLSQFCIAFLLNKWFLTDNRTVFLAPKGGFCANCFLRRYMSEFDPIKVSGISEKALSLARKVDRTEKAVKSWACYSIELDRKVKAFELVPYESCGNCNKPEAIDAYSATKIYTGLLQKESTPRLEALRALMTSFGFARSFYTGDKLGFLDERFEKILGGNYFSRVISRIVTSDGNLADIVSLGYADNSGLAETKAIMEYLERYAFIEHTCPSFTKEYDNKIIKEFTELYSRDLTQRELKSIKSMAMWGVNLSTGDVRPVPLRFIFDKGDLTFIKPCSNGFAAHINFKSSLTGSILELVERDAFIRFWHDPRRAYRFEPDGDEKCRINDVVSVLKELLTNENLNAACFVVKSPTMLPVVMTTITSADPNRAPSLVFGYGVAINLMSALQKSLDELRTNACNMLAGVLNDKEFLSREFDNDIKSIPDRMNYYSTKSPRARLKFLDMDNPLTSGIFEEAKQETLESIVGRLAECGIDVYGIDVTPKCFRDKNVFVTRAFSPHIYPLQYEEETSFNIPTSSLSVKNDLPHFFI